MLTATPIDPEEQEMDIEQAYNQLHDLLDEHGNASDFEALDLLWISTGRANDLISKQRLLDQHSEGLRRRQGRTVRGG
jgi:hypothetical protein